MVKDNALRSAVWNSYIDYPELTTNKCFICHSAEITPFSFILCHVIPESQGGKMTLENLRPGCVACNSGSGDRELMEYRRSTLPLQVCFFTDCANEATCGWYCPEHSDEEKPKADIIREGMSSRLKKNREYREAGKIKIIESPKEPEREEVSFKTMTKEKFSIPVPSKAETWSRHDYQKLQEIISPFYSKVYTYKNVMDNLLSIFFTEMNYQIYMNNEGSLTFRKRYQSIPIRYFVLCRDLKKNTVATLMSFCSQAELLFKRKTNKSELMEVISQFLDENYEEIDENEDFVVYRERSKGKKILSIQCYEDIFPSMNAKYYLDCETSALFYLLHGKEFGCYGTLIDGKYKGSIPEKFHNYSPDVVPVEILTDKFMMMTTKEKVLTKLNDKKIVTITFSDSKIKIG